MESVGSWILYKLDPKKPILYVLPIENIIGKLPVVPAGDTETIPFLLRKDFEGSGAYTDRQKGPGDGCQMWYVNSRALPGMVPRYLMKAEDTFEPSFGRKILMMWIVWIIRAFSLF